MNGLWLGGVRSAEELTELVTWRVSFVIALGEPGADTEVEYPDVQHLVEVSASDRSACVWRVSHLCLRRPTIR